MLYPFSAGAAESFSFGSNLFRVTDQATYANLQGDNVVAFERHYSPPDGTGPENATFYVKMEHTPAETDFIYWLYGEIDNNQSIVGGSLTKVIHFGLGDAHYVALFADPAVNPGGAGGGYGYEAAMFADAEHGFIATFQGTGPFDDVNPDQANCVGFEALVHDDGVDPTASGFAATNAGLFYAQNCLSNGFVIRMSEYANVGFSQFKLMDTDLRPIWEVFGAGIQRHNAAEATSGSQNQNASPFQFRNYYWNGSAEAARDVVFQPVVSGAPSGVASLQIQMGEPGSETTVGVISETSWDFQNQPLSNVGDFTMNGAATMDLQGVQVLNIGTLVPLATVAMAMGHHRDNVPTVHEPSGTTQTLDWDAGNTQIIDLDSATGDVTLTINNGEQGGRYKVIVVQGTVTRNLVWPASVFFPGGTDPTITAGIGSIDMIELVFDGTQYLGTYAQDFQ